MKPCFCDRNTEELDLESKLFEYLQELLVIKLQCCGSWMFIPDPGSWFLPNSRIPDPGSRIPDPKTATKERGEKFFFVIWYLLCSHKFHKIENYFSFKGLKKKTLGQFSKNYGTFYPKYCHKALKNMGLGSEIRDPEKTYSGSRIQGTKGTGSRILIRNIVKLLKFIFEVLVKWQQRKRTSVPSKKLVTGICKNYGGLFGWLK